MYGVHVWSADGTEQQWDAPSYVPEVNMVAWAESLCYDERPIVELWYDDSLVGSWTWTNGKAYWEC